MMPGEFETYLDERLLPASDALSRRARRAASLVARVTRAAAEGDMRTVEASLRDLQAQPVDEALSTASEAAAGFDYRHYLGQGFAADFEGACRAAQLPLEGHFPSYFVFPFAVRVDVENPSVIINRRRVGALRPSALVAAIQEERDRLDRSPFNAGEFIGVLFAAWDRMNAQQSVRNKVQVQQPQRLKDVYREIVPFARWRRDYPESFFGYDVQRLLLSDATRHNGWQVVLERGRSAANALRLVDRDGQERLISTVHFVEADE
jgi:hypothetical protein